MKKVFGFILLAVLVTACGGQLTVDNSVVEKLDLNRYLGDWYEIARFDHSFERGMDFCKVARLCLPVCIDWQWQ